MQPQSSPAVYIMKPSCNSSGFPICSGQAGISFRSVLVSDPPVHGTLCPETNTDHRGRGEGKGDKTGSEEKSFWFFSSLNHHHKNPQDRPENDASCSVLHHVLVSVNSR